MVSMTLESFLMVVLEHFVCESEKLRNNVHVLLYLFEYYVLSNLMKEISILGIFITVANAATDDLYQEITQCNYFFQPTLYAILE